MSLSRLMVLVLLIISTLVFFTFYERYKPIGPELLTDPNFSEGLAHWVSTGRGVAEAAEGGNVFLRVNEPGAGVALRQSLPNPGRYQMLRLAGVLKAQDIRPGERFWHKGRLALVSLDENQRMMKVPHLVTDLVGTLPWHTYQGIFRIPQNAREVRVSVQLIGATGTLVVKRLSLRQAQERDRYPLYRGLGISAWVLGLLWLGLPYRGRLRFDWRHSLIYLAAVGIFLGTLMPAPLKMEIGTALDTALARITAQHVDSDADLLQDLQTLPIPVEKLGHLLFFALLAFALRLAYPGKRRLSLLAGLMLLAVVSEVLQFFVEGRIPRVKDVLIDSAGLLTGIGLFELLYAVRQLMNRQHS